MVDNSGVRLYYSTTPREKEAAVFVLGDPDVVKQYQKIANGITEHLFTCPGGCTAWSLNEFNNKQPTITIFREHLHMHQKGIAIRNDLFRGENGDIAHTGLINFWDFAQQGGPSPVQDPFKVQPGDVFKLSCYYSDDGNTNFGIGTRQEMCMAFLFYYPRLTMTEGFTCGYYSGPSRKCHTSYAKQTLSGKSDVYRTFGSSKCALKEPDGPCPETSRCTGPLLGGRAKYSVTKKSMFRGCVSRCVSANFIRTWKIMGYTCGTSKCP